MAGRPDQELIVDPLAPGLDLKPFFDLMADERVVKVFHAARQDIEIVHYKARIVPKPVFDTQVAAMVCGFGEFDQLRQLGEADHQPRSRQVVAVYRLERGGRCRKSS